MYEKLLRISWLLNKILAVQIAEYFAFVFTYTTFCSFGIYRIVMNENKDDFFECLITLIWNIFFFALLVLVINIGSRIRQEVTIKKLIFNMKALKMYQLCVKLEKLRILLIYFTLISVRKDSISCS